MVLAVDMTSHGGASPVFFSFPSAALLRLPAARNGGVFKLQPVGINVLRNF